MSKRQVKYQVMQLAIGATGNGTAFTCSEFSEGIMATMVMQVKGITSATITFEATIDGTNWVAVQATPLTTGTAATTTAADGLFRLDCRGLVSVRARISAWVSGTITVTAVSVEE